MGFCKECGFNGSHLWDVIDTKERKIKELTKMLEVAYAEIKELERDYGRGFDNGYFSTYLEDGWGKKKDDEEGE